MSLSAPTPQPSMHVNPPTEFRRYRQVEYYDGKDRCVAEYRRRQYVREHVSSPTPSVQYHGPLSEVSSSNEINPASSERRVGDSSRSLPERNGNVLNHVTIPKRSPKKRSKPIIIQKGQPSGVKEDRTREIFESSDLPTPPPTPRFDRLPTPDVPDLADAPFCDCCVNEQTIKYCASCKSDLYRN